MGGPDATPNLWKQLFSAVRASGGYPGNGALFCCSAARRCATSRGRWMDPVGFNRHLYTGWRQFGDAQSNWVPEPIHGAVAAAARILELVRQLAKQCPVSKRPLDRWQQCRCRSQTAPGVKGQAATAPRGTSACAALQQNSALCQSGLKILNLNCFH